MDNEVGVRLGVKDRLLFSREMATARRDVDQFSAASARAGATMEAAWATATRGSYLLAAGLGAVAAASGFLAFQSIKLAGEWEQNEIAFTTMLGSAKEAKSFLDDLTDFAASTPFELTGLTKTSRQLLAFGFEVEDIIPMLTDIGDAVGGLGGGVFEIERVTRALGQMKAKGKVQAQEMLQMAELGIPAWQYLADAAKMSIAEVMAEGEKGALKADWAIKNILKGMQNDFGGMMEAQSQTVLGLWSTVMDNVKIMGRDVGLALIDTFDLKGKMKGAIGWLTDTKEAVAEFLDLFKKNGLKGAIDETFGPGTWDKVKMGAGAVLGMLVPAFVSLAAAVGATMLVLAPFAVAGALIVKHWDEVSAFFKGTFMPIVQDVFDRFKDLWRDIGPVVKDAVGAIMDFVGEAVNWLREIWRRWGGFITHYLKSTWEAVVQIFRGAFKVIKGVFQVFSAILKGDWKQLWEGIKSILSGAWDIVKGIVRRFWEGIKLAFNIGFDIVKEIWERLWKGIWWVIKKYMELALKPIEFIIDRIQDAIELAQKLLGFVKDAFGSVGSTGIEEGLRQYREQTDGRQAGGSVIAGVPYLVGEREAEIYVPKQTGSIAPVSAVEAFRGIGGITIGDIIVHESGNPQVTYRTVKKAVEDAAARK